MKNCLAAATSLLAALYCLSAAAGAMSECEDAGSQEAVLKCLSDLDLETAAALKKVETAAGRAAHTVEDDTKRPGAYTAFAGAARAFALYQVAQCDYVRAMQPGAGARPNTPAAGAADLAKIACRVDLARERIDTLK
jgi:hypothetical protein